jgi:NAD+ diphosphatase
MNFLSASSPANLTSATYYIPVSDNNLLCAGDGAWHPLTQADFGALGLITLSQHFIGYLNHSACWVVEVGNSVDTPEIADTRGRKYRWLGLRSQLGLINEEQFVLAGRALQVLQWHRDHQFCGRCGHPTAADEDERAKVCHPCNLRFYPRLSPCIITLVTRRNECLLARHARSSQPIYTALAGFVEVGERPEDTIHREIHEEVGIQVQDLRYVASQPWPFPGQLMLGFYAEYAGGDICVDGNEIIDAQWYRYDRLPQVPPIATLSGQLIAGFITRHNH